MTNLPPHHAISPPGPRSADPYAAPGKIGRLERWGTPNRSRDGFIWKCLSLLPLLMASIPVDAVIAVNVVPVRLAGNPLPVYFWVLVTVYFVCILVFGYSATSLWRQRRRKGVLAMGFAWLWLVGGPMGVNFLGVKFPSIMWSLTL